MEYFGNAKYTYEMTNISERDEISRYLNNNRYIEKEIEEIEEDIRMYRCNQMEMQTNKT